MNNVALHMYVCTCMCVLYSLNMLDFVFCPAFEKVVHYRGQEFLTKLVDTAGQVSCERPRAGMFRFHLQWGCNSRNISDLKC